MHRFLRFIIIRNYIDRRDYILTFSFLQDNLFFSDMYNNRIRKITASSIISTIAGTGVASYSGDAGKATSATLNGPVGVAVDTSGN